MHILTPQPGATLIQKTRSDFQVGGFA